MHFDYDAFHTELARRGWQGMNEMDSMGKCHLNEQHYLLTTDGLIIYSSIPMHRNVKYFKNELKESWDANDDEYSTNVFSWEKLDAVIKMVEEQRTSNSTLK